MKTVIVDYGMGNLRSIQHKLKKIGINALVSSDPSNIGKAQFLIMPGVGNFAKGMENIKQHDILNILYLSYSFVFSIVILGIGIIMFNKVERIFMDTI